MRTKIRSMVHAAMLMALVLPAILWAHGAQATTACSFTIVGTTMTLGGDCTTGFVDSRTGRLHSRRRWTHNHSR